MNYGVPQLGAAGFPSRMTIPNPSNETGQDDTDLLALLYPGGTLDTGLSPHVNTQQYDGFLNQNTQPGFSSIEFNNPESDSTKSSSPKSKSNSPKSNSSRSDEIPCPYTNCRFRAKTNRDVKRHRESVHDKKRPHRCTQASCPRATRGFARKDGLTRHQRTRHGIVSGSGQINKPILPSPTIKRNPSVLLGRNSTLEELKKMSKGDLIMRVMALHEVARQQQERLFQLTVENVKKQLETDAKDFQHGD